MNHRATTLDSCPIVSKTVIPAQAGIQRSEKWSPVCAGMRICETHPTEGIDVHAQFQ
jgi:hypothetical protein